MERESYCDKGCIRFRTYPHEEITVDRIPWKRHKKAFMANWTDHFDCGEETRFWFCIKDTPLDLAALKANRRYEINRGNRNFEARLIDPEEYAGELYAAYEESLKGYPPGTPMDSEEVFLQRVKGWKAEPAARVFAVFHRETGRLCGYADVYVRGRYLPISSMKTDPDYEKIGVNFALLYGICTYFEQELSQGAYLCDGARNILHQTNFQPFLEKYFGFRKAYCHLHVKYRWFVRPVIGMLYPLRRRIPKKGVFYKIRQLLVYEAWSRGEEQ